MNTPCYTHMAFASTFTGGKVDLRLCSPTYFRSLKLKCMSTPNAEGQNYQLATKLCKEAKLASSSTFDRRLFIQVASTAAISLVAVRNIRAEATDFAVYNGPISLGYSFSYPSSWSVKKKPIKTHLSEVIVTDNEEPSTTAGLVVDSVKLESINKFGSPDAVGQKVVAVETKKESVKSASVTSAQSVDADGLTYYVLDYIVVSSHGTKRYVAKATVTGGQLYVFTAQGKVEHFNEDTERTFSQMLDSFNVKKQYS